MEFAEQIMVDLINQGYSGSDLHEHFKEEVNQAGHRGDFCASEI